MKTIQTIITPVLIALAMSTFTACSDSDSNTTPETETEITNTYILNATESKDIPLDSQILSVSTEEAQVKLTRDVEANVVNVHVLSGSVEVTEVVE